MNSWAQTSEIHSEVWILEFLGFSSGENKNKEKQEKRRAHYKKKIAGKLFKRHWKLERKVKKPSVQVDGLCSLKEILSQGKHNWWDIQTIWKGGSSASRNCTLYLWCLDIKGKEMANISSSIEWTRRKYEHLFDFFTVDMFLLL